MVVGCQEASFGNEDGMVSSAGLADTPSCVRSEASVCQSEQVCAETAERSRRDVSRR